jgi:hypothetical protein
MPQQIIKKVEILINAYKTGLLGDITMPEDTHPVFKTREEKLVYYTLPMALNYQRDSFKLWVAAKETWEDELTKDVFNIANTAKISFVGAQHMLIKHKLALQPNKHVATWRKISGTIYQNWGSIDNLIVASQNDFVKLRELIQYTHKGGFPYLSGPKIFNYWSHILTLYCDVELKNRSLIEIAPDTHIIKASVKLGVITESDADKISRENLSLKWRTLLMHTDIDPIDVHSPLWFWSRSGFKYEL